MVCGKERIHGTVETKEVSINYSAAMPVSSSQNCKKHEKLDQFRQSQYSKLC